MIAYTNYSTSLFKHVVTLLWLSLFFSSQCACILSTIHYYKQALHLDVKDHERACLAKFYVDAALKSMVCLRSFTPNDLYSNAFPCTSTEAAF